MPASNVTVTAQWSGISGVGTSVIKGAYYGDTVNYSASGVTGWQVFLNDSGYVYIIASDYVPVSTFKAGGVLTNGDYGVYASSSSTIKSWLQTSSYWSPLTSGLINGVAYGGPTLDQFVKFYNGKHGTSYNNSTSQA